MSGLRIAKAIRGPATSAPAERAPSAMAWAVWRARWVCPLTTRNRPSRAPKRHPISLAKTRPASVTGTSPRWEAISPWRNSSMSRCATCEEVEESSDINRFVGRDLASLKIFDGVAEHVLLEVFRRLVILVGLGVSVL